MSLQEVVKRAINDEEFRALLASDPEAALAEYDGLSDEDRNLLLSAKQEKDFSKFLEKLGKRISKTSFMPFEDDI